MNLFDQEGYSASNLLIHSAGTGADTDEKRKVAPAIRQALRTKVAGLQVQAGIVESSTRFYEILIGGLNNKVDVLAANQEMLMKYEGINNNYQQRNNY